MGHHLIENYCIAIVQKKNKKVILPLYFREYQNTAKTDKKKIKKT